MERIGHNLSIKDLGAHSQIKLTWATIATVLILTSGKKISLISDQISHQFIINDTPRASPTLGGNPSPTQPPPPRRIRC